jgi:hypothetical protein
LNEFVSRPKDLLLSPGGEPLKTAQALLAAHRSDRDDISIACIEASAAGSENYFAKIAAAIWIVGFFVWGLFGLTNAGSARLV